jgi:RNA polymerase sigma factor FliA
MTAGTGDDAGAAATGGAAAQGERHAHPSGSAPAPESLGDAAEAIRAARAGPHAALLECVAGRVVDGLPPGEWSQDLLEAGAIGLVKAASSYDVRWPEPFEIYAARLIRAAMLELHREEMWIPRSIRERLRALESACLDIEAHLGCAPSVDDLACGLRLTCNEYRQLLAETARIFLLSLDDIPFDNGIAGHPVAGGSGRGDRPLGGEEDAVPKAWRAVAAAIERLPEPEHTVAALRYYDGLTFAEIAERLRLRGACRALEIHAQAVLRVRAYLSAAPVETGCREDCSPVDASAGPAGQRLRFWFERLAERTMAADRHVTS